MISVEHKICKLSYRPEVFNLIRIAPPPHFLFFCYTTTSKNMLFDLITIKSVYIYCSRIVHVISRRYHIVKTIGLSLTKSTTFFFLMYYIHGATRKTFCRDACARPAGHVTRSLTVYPCVSPASRLARP